MNSNFDKKQTLQELAINQLHKTLNTSQDAIEETVRFLAGSPMILGIEEKEIQEVILKIHEIAGIDMDIGSMIQEDSDEFKTSCEKDFSSSLEVFSIIFSTSCDFTNSS